MQEVEELVGQEVEVLLREARRDVHMAHRAPYLAAPRNRPMGTGYDLADQCRDAIDFPQVPREGWGMHIMA